MLNAHMCQNDIGYFLESAGYNFQDTWTEKSQEKYKQDSFFK
jgi:hypothetical protein